MPTAKNRSAERSKVRDGPTVELPTAGEVLPSGEFLELVRDPSNRNRLGLLSWDGRKVRIASAFPRASKLYVPIQVDPSLVRALILPDQVRPYRSARLLHTRITELVSAQLDLPSDTAKLIGFFVIASWFVDVVPLAPALLLSGPVCAEAETLLRTLSCLCRRAILLAEMAASTFRYLPIELQPTLLIDQLAMPKPVQGLLRGSGRRGIHIINSGRCADPCCARAVFAANNKIEPAVSEAMLRVLVIPSPTRSAVLSDEQADEIAAELQPQLLMYRLANYSRVRASSFDAPDFLQPVRDMARSLGAAIVADEELQREVISVLKPKDAEVRGQLDVQPEGAVLMILVARLHEGAVKYVAVRELTEGTNALLRARGEILEYNPSEIGRRLEALGVARSRSTSGSRVRLDRATSRVVHYLARRYGVLMPQVGGSCPDCQELAST